MRQQPDETHGPFRPDGVHTLSGVLRDLEEHNATPGPVEEVRQLVQELEIHRIELESQNHQLRESQALLEQSRARYADLYDFAPVAYLSLDSTGRIIEANLTAAAFLGIERSRLVGRFLTSFVPDDRRAEVRAHLQACLRDNIRTSAEVPVAGRRGRRAMAQMLSTPVLGEGGSVVGCRTTMTDISAVKHVQDTLEFLAQASASLSSSFDYAANIADVARRAVPIAADVCIVDLVEPDGSLGRLEVAAANPSRQRLAAAARLMRPKRERGTALDAVLELRKPLIVADYRPFTGAGPDHSLEHESFVRACGPRSIMYVPIVARGVALGVFTFVSAESSRQFGNAERASAEDLANRAAMAIENARLYEDAQKAVKAREQILAFVSHDLKNPLMGILLSVELLLGSAPADERRRGWTQLERIRRGVQQMRHMVEDLLDAGSIDAGRLSVSPGDADLVTLTQDVLAILQPLARDKEIQIQIDVAPQAQHVCCDRDRVVQVLYNLIGNALKFTPRSGQIRISAHAAGSTALIAVHDTGPGVPQEVVPRLFQRYGQAADTARRGRGLGLFISRAIVEAHGGSIWADLQSERGARFCFTLPLAPAPTVPNLSPEMPSTDRDSDHPAADGRT